jgi:hypothetical protein
MQRLWNAVDSRIRLLSETYGLTSLARLLGWRRKSDDADMLEMLTRLGLIRPLLLRQLKDVRNVVEHSDAGAPSEDECLNYLDVVWYFLRSTDIFVSRIFTDADLVDDDEIETEPSDTSPQGRGRFVSLNFDFETWSPGINGWFRSGDMAPDRDSSSIAVTLSAPVVTRDDLSYIRGHIRPGSESFGRLVHDYFQLGLVDTRGGSKPSEPFEA